jgi:hypothetical protein
VSNDDFTTALGSKPAVIDVLENDQPAASVVPSSVKVTSGPAHGTATVDTGSGAITYTAVAGFRGTDTLRYDVKDNTGQTTVPALVTIVVIRPTANDDAADTDGTNPVTVDILANDTPSSPTATLDPTTVAIVGQPAHGKVTFDAQAGGLTYTADPGYRGSDTIHYTVADSDGAVSNTASVTIVVNRPTANDDSASTDKGQSVSIIVLANDTDPDGNNEINPASVKIVSGPAHGSVQVDSTGAVTYTPAAGFAGTDSFGYTITDFPGAESNVAAVRIHVNYPTAERYIVAAADAGVDPRVNVYSADGALKTTIMAYPVSFGGGVRVAVGDVDGDGIPDIITAPGAGTTPLVKVFSGANFQPIGQFLAYGAGFQGGVFVAAADVNGDGRADIITGAGAGGGPHVKVFDGATGATLKSFYAYSAGFQGGVSVAAADVNGDGKADIITGAGAGGGPHVKVFDSVTGATLRSFYAYSANFHGGVNVSAGDTNGDGFADVITGAGAGGGPHVKVFDGSNGAVLQSFFAFGAIGQGGVRVASGDANDDGLADLIVSPGPGAPDHVRVLNGQTLAEFDTLDQFASFNGGVFVGAI